MPTVKFKSVATSWIKSRKRRQVSDAGERLWVALLLESDSYGDTEVWADDIAADLFRGVYDWTESKVSNHLRELSDAGLIIRWSDQDGRPWAHIVGHDKHQSSVFIRKRGNLRPSGGFTAQQINKGYPSATPVLLEEKILEGKGTRRVQEETPTGEVAANKSLALLPSSVDTVFQHWKQAFNKRASTVLDTKRKKRIEWAIKTYGEQAVLKCVSGYAADDWVGRKDNHDLTLLLRDAAHVERGLELGEKPDNGYGDVAGTVIHV